MQTRVITAHIPLPLAKQIDKLAEQMERPRGWIVKQALRDWVEIEEWKHQETLKALKEVDEGQIISHDEMIRWATQLVASSEPKTKKRARKAKK